MRRSERGANLLEMALVTPVLLLLLAGVIDLGRAFYTYIIIANSAREGARLAARLPCYPENPTQRTLARDAIINAAIAEAANSGVQLYPGNVSIDPNPATSCAGAGNPIRVTVSYQYQPWMSGITGIGSFVLSSSTVMIHFGNDQI